MTLKQEILIAANVYAGREALQPQFGQLTSDERAALRESLQAALLSGVALTARYLVAHDGSSRVTPQLVEQAVVEIAKDIGFDQGKLAP